MDLTAQALVDVLAVRWEVESYFEYVKDLLGSDHYQVMTRQAILRFWALMACLFCFLEEQRAAAQEATLTCGDVRRQLHLLILTERAKAGRLVETGWRPVLCVLKPSPWWLTARGGAAWTLNAQTLLAGNRHYARKEAGAPPRLYRRRLSKIGQDQ
jgi:hypothetical protein